MTWRFDVEFSRGALRDLDEIGSYMAQVRGDDDASALVTALLDRADSLRTFPHRGSAPADLTDLDEAGFRQLLHRHYRIIYSVRGSTVRVVLVANGRRDIRALFQDRLGRSDPPA